MDYAEILSDYGIKFERREDKLIVKCPFHGDSTASGAIFHNSGNFNCLGCSKASNLYRFIAACVSSTPNTIYFQVQQKYPTKDTKTIPASNVERFHNAIWKDENLLKNLRDRGINDKTIREFKLGCNQGRIVIPIRNEQGYFVNLRHHKPGALEKKVINQRTFGKPIRWFPVDQLAYDEILVTGGELKVLCALQQLNEHGIGAITGTWGEGQWTKDILFKLKDVIVYVCMDVDKSGQDAAERMCIDLQGIALKIYKVVLPLDKEKFPKGDINDFKGNLKSLLDETEEWKHQIIEEYSTDEKPIQTTLTESTHADYANKRLSLRAVVSAVEEAPFSIPKIIDIVCDRDSKYCSICSIPMKCSPNSQLLTIEKENPALLKMVGVSDKEQHRVFQETFKIPKLCPKVSFDPKAFHNIEHVCLSSEPDLKSRNGERSMQSAYCVGDGITLNECYSLTGRMFPHPKSQQATLLLSDYATTEDALSTYELTDLERLKIFQPERWTKEGIQHQLDKIYFDLEANVTRIFKRRELHLAYDLAYHSPLFLQFDGLEEKGWVQVLVVGYSSQGKSDVAEFMMNHYGLGEKVDCDGATAAGLIGGVAKFGERHFITWGVLPQNDRRLVFLEELKGATTEVISKMKETRSSGWASLTKIEKRRTHARTRLVCMSNPRGKTSISAYNYGINAVLELIGSPEDVRRFDMVVILDRNEVNIEDLQNNRPRAKVTYTSELCRDLVLFCWTCKKVRFEDEQRVFQAAAKLCKKFTDEIPIVDRGSMRFKIAKLSAALAGRTFSIEGEDTILVRVCHIEYIEKFLTAQYSKPGFGYAEYSKAMFEAEILSDSNKVKNYILTETKDPKVLVNALLQEELVDVFFIQDLLAYDPDTARRLISYLLVHRGLKREGRFYRKTTGLTQLLKDMENNGDFTIELPEHLKGKY
jgi:hypothetical protein